MIRLPAIEEEQIEEDEYSKMLTESQRDFSVDGVLSSSSNLLLLEGVRSDRLGSSLTRFVFCEHRA